MPSKGPPALVAILAGGRGTRMGGPKASALLAGRPLLDYPVAAARAAGLEVAVVAKPQAALPQLSVAVWEEPAKPLHPLCGLVCALRQAGDRAVVAVACDMPFVTAPLLSWLADAEGEVVPELGGRLHPLLARYRTQSIGALAAALERRTSAQEAARELKPRLVGDAELGPFGEPERLLFNVNTPADLERAQAWVNQG